LELQYDKLLPSVGFNFNLRRYTTWKVDAPAIRTGASSAGMCNL